MNFITKALTKTISSTIVGIQNTVTAFEYISYNKCCNTDCPLNKQDNKQRFYESNLTTSYIVYEKHECNLDCYLWKLEFAIGSNHYQNCFKTILQNIFNLYKQTYEHIQQNIIEQIINTIITVFSRGIIIYHKIKYIEIVYELFNDDFTKNKKIIKMIFDYGVTYENITIIEFLHTINVLDTCIHYIDIVLNKNSLNIIKYIYEKIGKICYNYINIGHCESEEMVYYLLNNGYILKTKEYEIPLKYKFANNLSTLRYLIEYLIDYNIKVNKSLFYSNVEDFNCLELLFEKNIITNIQIEAVWIFKKGIQQRIKVQYKNMDINQRNKFKKDFPYLYDFFIGCHTVQKPFK